MGVTAGCVGGSDVGDGGGVSSAQHMNSIEPFGKYTNEIGHYRASFGAYFHTHWFLLIGFYSLDFTQDGFYELPGMNNGHDR